MYEFIVRLHFIPYYADRIRTLIPCIICFVPSFRRLEIGGCILNIFVDLREYIYSIPVYIFINIYMLLSINLFMSGQP